MVFTGYEMRQCVFAQLKAGDRTSTPKTVALITVLKWNDEKELDLQSFLELR